MCTFRYPTQNITHNLRVVVTGQLTYLVEMIKIEIQYVIVQNSITLNVHI